METKHTPGLLTYGPRGEQGTQQLPIRANGKIIAAVRDHGTLSDARRFVLTWNAHDLLVKKLTDTVAWLDREIEGNEAAQGEWAAVQEPYAPAWVQVYKDAVERLTELRDDLSEPLRKIREGK